MLLVGAEMLPLPQKVDQLCGSPALVYLRYQILDDLWVPGTILGGKGINVCS